MQSGGCYGRGGKALSKDLAGVILHLRSKGRTGPCVNETV